MKQEIVSKSQPNGKKKGIVEEEEDPLETYMASVAEKQRRAGVDPSQASASSSNNNNAASTNDDDVDSDEEVYAAAAAAEAADEMSHPRDKRQGPMEQLAPLDHKGITYTDFRKAFYDEDPEIFAMSPAEVAALRKELDVRVEGNDAPRPVQEWSQLNFDESLNKELKKHGFEKPTPIQCQALPAALSGRDVIGIAQTGSGKTAAYVLPMLVGWGKGRGMRGEVGVCFLLQTREFLHLFSPSPSTPFFSLL